jgi:peptidoglycan/LPS O-acetylase OafA/YrhL
VGIGCRALIYTRAQDTSLLVNQMPAFLDVYALGMLGAMLYVEYVKIAKPGVGSKVIRRILPWVGTAVFILSLFGIVSLLRLQASANGFEAIRLSQLLLRLPFALVMLWAMLSAAIMPRFLQKLLDNRLLRFIAMISYNLYIWHQLLAVQLRQAFFPDTFRTSLPMQWAYTLLCFSVSILTAMLATYGVEQPCAKLAQSFQKYWRKKHHEGPQTAKA